MRVKEWGRCQRRHPRSESDSGLLRVHPESGELRKHGIRIRLQDQPCRILLALLENPGEVVTREELRRRIWGEDTFVDFDHSLSAAVNRLREALSDTAENPRYIETMARRGYRFIAPVEGSPRQETQDFTAEILLAIGLGDRRVSDCWRARDLEGNRPRDEATTATRAPNYACRGRKESDHFA